MVAVADFAEYGNSTTTVIVDGKPKDVPAEKRASLLAELPPRAQTLRKQLASAFGTLERQAFVPLSKADPHLDVVSKTLRSWHSQTIDRFESVIKPGARACLAKLDDVIRKCSGDKRPRKGA